MRKAIIKDIRFTNFKRGDIIDVYSIEEVLSANINEDSKRWLNEDINRFIGLCLSEFNPLEDGTTDFTGFYEGDIKFL